MDYKLTGDKELANTLKAMSEKSTEATAYALNGLAYDIRKEVQGKLPDWVNVTRPFLPNSVVYERATNSNPVAYVGFAKRANFVMLLEKGGDRKPVGTALAIPVNAKTNSKGSITAGNRPKAILSRAGFFSGVLNGVAGIWQKTKRIPLRLMFAFKKTAHYKSGQIHFEQTANEVIKRNAPEKFKYAITKMITSFAKKS